MSCHLEKGENVYDHISKSTISLHESTHEDFRFVPNFEVGIRRTSSLDDISRFYRYFDLVRGNLGMIFTWQQYLKILQEQLSNFETITILGKAMLPLFHPHQSEELTQVSKLQTPSFPFDKSLQSSDCTPIDVTSLTQEKDLLTISAPQFDCVDFWSAAERSISTPSECSTSSLTNRSRILLKICAETKSLAQKICKTADIISRLPHKCSECGTSLDGRRHKKFCIQRTDTGGDMAGNLEDILKVKGQISTELSDFKTKPFQVTTFAEKQSTGAGELTHLPLSLPEESPDKKCSLKRLAKTCKQFITRK